MSITQTLVKDLFEYNDGVLYWKNPTSVRMKKGLRAGRYGKRGYMETSIHYNRYKNHRIIFLMFHGYLPKIVDHIDNNRLNNKIENLRAVTCSQNLQNAKLSKSNTTGIKGVVWEKDRKYWKAQIMVNGKQIRIGKLKSLELAELVVQELRNKYHGEYANHG
jgi:hypothetical protein